MNGKFEKGRPNGEIEVSIDGTSSTVTFSEADFSNSQPEVVESASASVEAAAEPEKIAVEEEKKEELSACLKAHDAGPEPARVYVPVEEVKAPAEPEPAQTQTQTKGKGNKKKQAAAKEVV